MKFQILDVLNNEIDAASVELQLGDIDFFKFFYRYSWPSS